MTIHELKSWSKFFGPIIRGERTHELRRNDREYKVGDFLQLKEFDEKTDFFTGRSCLALVTSITSEDEPCAVSIDALKADFCILSIQVTEVKD